MLELMLEGYECEGITIEISLPGNCHPVTLTAALLLGNTALTSQHGLTCRVCCVCFTADPVYPKPAGLKVVLLNNASFALTWAHPNTGALLEVEDEEYTYSVKGEVVATNEVSSNTTLTLTPLLLPGRWWMSVGESVRR